MLNDMNWRLSSSRSTVHRTGIYSIRFRKCLTNNEKVGLSCRNKFCVSFNVQIMRYEIKLHHRLRMKVKTNANGSPFHCLADIWVAFYGPWITNNITYPRKSSIIHQILWRCNRLVKLSSNLSTTWLCASIEVLNIDICLEYSDKRLSLCTSIYYSRLRSI